MRALQIVITLGGSACTDGGSGALAALGARFIDAAGAELPLGGGSLKRLNAVDLSELVRLPELACLTDVRAPLLGPSGAASVYGPQKGAGLQDIAILEAGLYQLAAALGGDPDQRGAGAAGGCGYGLGAVCGATLGPGAHALAALAGLPAALADADLVITGEGQYDATSHDGKVVGVVRELAEAARVPMLMVTGKATADPPAGVQMIELAELAGRAEIACAAPAEWLANASAMLATAWPANAKFAGQRQR
jgi:glycerate 2-kinase